MKATLVLRTDKINKKDFCPINIRIIAKGVVSYLPTDISIHKNHWDGKKQLVKSKSVLANDINFKLQEDLAAINKLILSNYNEYMHIDANEIKKKLYQTRIREVQPSFLEESKKYVEKFKGKGKIGTYDDRLSKLAQIEEYCPSMEINSITSKFVTGFKEFLEQKGNGSETVYRKIKFLKTLYRHYCHEYELIRKDSVFDAVKPPSKTSSIKFMNEGQLRAFSEVAVRTEREQLYKDMFLFVVKGIGLRVSDLLTLKWEHIDYSDRLINKVSIKTGKTLSVKIPLPAYEIITKLKSTCSVGQSFIFDILDDESEDFNIPEVLDRAISRETASYNKFLNRVGKQIGLPFNLSSHKARHSFATRALRRGLPLHYVQHALGHHSVKETEIYARVVKQGVDEAIDKFLRD